ncbi:MAG: branched-chain amino acid ABC transporter permease, partial [Burkholderiales bacterium]
MLYRESGQFKTSYAADMAVFPIRQDRWLVAILVAVAYVGLPLIASGYLFRAILIPFLILALAAIGLNLLVGYCGQISLGTGGFMAVGAYAAYNLCLRIEWLPMPIAILLAGVIAAMAGIVFGIPSLRIKGFYLAVATLAAQFFIDWLFARIRWFTNYTPSGSIVAPRLDVFGWILD